MTTTYTVRKVSREADELDRLITTTLEHVAKLEGLTETREAAWLELRQAEIGLLGIILPSFVRSVAHTRMQWVANLSAGFPRPIPDNTPSVALYGSCERDRLGTGHNPEYRIVLLANAGDRPSISAAQTITIEQLLDRKNPYGQRLSRVLASLVVSARTHLEGRGRDSAASHSASAEQLRALTALVQAAEATARR
jgi:hypothetical protein